MSDHLSLDLVTNILLRLPVAAILRCRAICKPWRALIDSPRFSKLQIDHSSATTENAVLFILENDGHGNGDLHIAPYIEGLRRETCIDVRSNRSSPPQIGVKIPRERVTLIGSCDGLVCFDYDTDKAIITNPATRKSHVMSAMPKHLCGDGDGIYHCGCGFGYDSVSDDYKVVKLNQMMLFSAKNADCFQSELISYGVRSGSSVVVKFPYILALTEKVGVFVGGAIHWVVHTPDVSNLIVGFDLGRNECKEIPQPEYRNEKKSLLLRIGELEKCMCIFANYRGRVLDVWMMKEYGVKESWSKMLSVPHPGLCYDIRVRSLGYSMTGQDLLLLLDSQRLVWYDLKKNPQKGDAAKEITISGLKAVFVDAIVCFGSLVSPHGKSPTKEEVKIDRQRKKRDGFLSSGFKLKL